MVHGCCSSCQKKYLLTRHKAIDLLKDVLKRGANIKILILLAQRPKHFYSIKEMAEETGMHYSYAYIVVKELMRKGFIEIRESKRGEHTKHAKLYQLKRGTVQDIFVSLLIGISVEMARGNIQPLPTSTEQKL